VEVSGEPQVGERLDAPLAWRDNRFVLHAVMFIESWFTEE
jgi:hypothetical protein